MKTTQSKSAAKTLAQLAGKIKRVRCGHNLYLYTDADKTHLDSLLRKQAIKTGEAIYWSDGSREWFDYVEVIDPAKQGSEVYTWDSSGNRCLHYRVWKHVATDGTMTCRIDGTCYRSPK